MSITVVCPQGHRLTAGEKLAGKKLACPKCGSVVQIPAADPSPPSKAPAPAHAGVRAKTPVKKPIARLTPNPANHPLGLGDPLAPSDSQTANLATGFDPLPLPTQPAAVAARTVQPPAPSRRPAVRFTPLMWATAGAGICVGLILAAIVGWLLLGGRRESLGSADAPAATDPPRAIPAAVSLRQLSWPLTDQRSIHDPN